MNNLDQIFTALSDGTRRAILAQLAQGETSLSDIAAPYDMSQTAVSKHIRVLSNAQLVEVTKRGRTRYCRLTPGPMKQANDWLATYQAFWQQQFEALAHHLEDTK